MKTTKKIITLLFGMSVILGSLILAEFNDPSIPMQSHPFSSEDAQINPEDVSIYLDGIQGDNNTKVYREIDTLNITVTVPDEVTLWAYFNVNLTFSDLTFMEFNLTQIGTTRQYTGDFTPSFENITGPATIEILARDVDGDAVESGGNKDAKFEIMNNAPVLEVVLPSTEIYREDTLSIDVVPSDIEDEVANLDWEVALYNEESDSPEILVFDDFHIDYDFSNDSYVGMWTINATCSDTDSDENSQYFDFWVLDNEPIITSIVFMVDEEIINIDAYNFKRDSTIEISLNVSDSDTQLDDLRLKISALNPGEIFGNIFDDIEAIEIGINTTSTFVENITIPTDINIGNTKFDFEIYHESDTTFETVLTSESKNVEITNNAPVLHGFEINRIDAEETLSLGDHISITQGEYIGFRVNASDVEDDIQYVQVNLLYRDPITSETTEFNYTAPYQGALTEVNIRSVDLPVGEIIVYISVIDGDGATGRFISPYSFDIIEENEALPMIWLMLVVGLVLGGALSVGILNATLTRQIERKVLLRLEGASTQAKTPQKSRKQKNITESASSDESDIDSSTEETPETQPKKKKKVVRRL